MFHPIQTKFCALSCCIFHHLYDSAAFVLYLSSFVWFCIICAVSFIICMILRHSCCIFYHLCDSASFVLYLSSFVWFCVIRHLCHFLFLRSLFYLPSGSICMHLIYLLGSEITKNPKLFISFTIGYHQGFKRLFLVNDVNDAKTAWNLAESY